MDIWEEDMILAKEDESSRNRTVRQLSEEEELNKKRKVALKLLSGGQISKAMNIIKSHGIADISDHWVKEQLRAKYPERLRDLPAVVTKGSCVTNLKGLRERLLNLKRGISLGTGGLRAEFLITLAQTLEEDKMLLLEDLGQKYLSGALPPRYYKIVESVMTLSAFKNSQKDTLRPLGVKHQLVRVFHQEGVRQNRAELQAYLEPQQLAMSQAGGGKLIHSVRMLAEERRDFVVVKLDMKNADNQSGWVDLGSEGRLTCALKPSLVLWSRQ